jgi:hypothetical protein
VSVTIFEAVTAVNIKITVFPYVTPYISTYISEEPAASIFRVVELGGGLSDLKDS